MKSFPTLALAGLASAFAAQSVQAQTVLYSDSFTRTTGVSDFNGLADGSGNGSSDWGTNDNAAGGTVSQAWITGPEGRTGGANQSTNGSVANTINGGAFYGFDAAAVSPNGFSVGFDFTRDTDGDGSSADGYIAVGFGVASTTASGGIGGGGFALNSDLAVLFQQAKGTNAGNTEVFEDNNNLNPGTAQGPLDYGNANATHSALITAIPQLAGAYGDAASIDVSVSVDGGAAYDFTILGGDDFGTLAFSSNGFTNRGYDNVVVTALVPEPASLALVALGGAALLGRRRRA